jgi:hypothetical protein
MIAEGLTEIKKQTFRDVYWGNSWKEVNAAAIAHVRTPTFLAMNDSYMSKVNSDNQYEVKVKPHSSASSSSKHITLTSSANYK